MATTCRMQCSILILPKKVFQLSPVILCRSLSDDFHKRNEIGNTNSHGRSQDVRKEFRNVTSFYYQSAIDAAAMQPSVRLTPAAILYSGKSPDRSHILRSVQYLSKELPVRIAHRINGFRNLPFIVGCHPIILSVHELFIRAFHILSDFGPIKDLEQEAKWAETLRSLLDDHKDVVTQLAEGFSECRKYVSDEALIKTFLDRTLTSRLGIRMLSEHHLSLHDEKVLSKLTKDRFEDYNFTTSGSLVDDKVDGGLFGQIMDNGHTGPAPGKMHGYGFGLPTSQAYAKYLGGSLTLETLDGIGTDVYLRLSHIDGRSESFRI
uniref:Protein-serine/threonine kinase n=1 Tax=Biomphalaria glabrata TaxID=6526 RepID=A0A2C9KRG6_BIOGL